MQPTPIQHQHNEDLLLLIPDSATKIVEVGCSGGALARAYKEINPQCHYVGIEMEKSYAIQAEEYCDASVVGNIESLDDGFWESQRDTDCWIFGDVLEHLQNPWAVLRRIRDTIKAEGCVLACIPNAQHWSLQLRLSLGDFRYEDQGLMDKTHLRWFTRQTIIEMFLGAGFEIKEGKPRIFRESHRDKFIPLIGEMARAGGGDPDAAMRDALPLQYVVKAIPKVGQAG